MPDIEFPGVFIEEVAFRGKPIEGVPTGVAGFVGLTVAGTPGVAKVVGSLGAFEAQFGARTGSASPGEPVPASDHLWHAARAFFGEGGKRLSIVRIADTQPVATAYAEALALLEDEGDVELVAAPGSTTGDPDLANTVATALIDHARRMLYRFALIDGPAGADIATIKAFRAPLESSRAALYYPWVRTIEGAFVPPSGFVAGIISANDAARGVWKAPANIAVNGATGFETEIGNAEQERLNPQGINCFRSFPGRGLRLWGARTLSRDPDYKYVPVRRLISFIERSIEAGCQWAVFEPNAAPLWARIVALIDAFLSGLWRQGALMGASPREAWFVKCDRTTMTQDDIDNGRLIVEIGIAPIKPGEFVVIRIHLMAASGIA